jgi:pimeloyl-ACP methyl ester carboxylesterase
MDQYIALPDGRQLCYVEYGDPAGKPLFAFHGNPNSRLIWGALPGALALPQIRLIAPDRPGYGQTDFAAGVTTVENWPNDVANLADALSIDRFAVFGASGGGPYALACAWKIPHRLTCAGIFASVGPFLPETSPGLNPMVRAMWNYAPRVPRLFKLQMRFIAWLSQAAPALYVKMVLKEFGPEDRLIYERLNLGERMRAQRAEGYRQGGIGSWYDSLLPARWPIPLTDIQTKVYLWQGEQDVSVPPAMGRYLAATIPDCEAEFIAGAGHFWIFEHLDQILAKLAAHKVEFFGGKFDPARLASPYNLVPGLRRMPVNDIRD